MTSMLYNKGRRNVRLALKWRNSGLMKIDFHKTDFHKDGVFMMQI